MDGTSEMDLVKKQTALVEAILFLENEPLTEEFISRVSGIPRPELAAAIERLTGLYADESHGLELVKIGGGFFFTPKKEHLELLRPRYGKKNESRLSKAALETLAIIAYSQPITRSEIESIRGVSADAMIRLLLSRNLVREVGKKDVPGHPVQYGTTKEFLMYFKLASISELPKLDEVEEQRFELR